MWQTQSVWPVRPAHISVLWTVNIVSQHRAVLIIFPLNLQTITITRMLSSRGEGEDCFRDWLQFSIDFYPTLFPKNVYMPVCQTSNVTGLQRGPSQHRHAVSSLILDVIHFTHMLFLIVECALCTRCECIRRSDSSPTRLPVLNH